jgi:hypothetical protein
LSLVRQQRVQKQDPVVIKAILAHLAGKARPVHAPRLPPASAFS